MSAAGAYFIVFFPHIESAAQAMWAQISLELDEICSMQM